MRRPGVAILALAAACSDARADSCDETAARVAAVAPQIAFNQRINDDYGGEIHFKHPGVESIQIICSRLGPNTVTAQVRTRNPDATFFDLIARMGSMETGLHVEKMRSAVRRCHHAALKSEFHSENLEIEGTEISCTILEVGFTTIEVAASK